MGAQMMHLVDEVEGVLVGEGLVLVVVHATVVLGHARVVAAAVVQEMIVVAVDEMTRIDVTVKRVALGLGAEVKVETEVVLVAKAHEMKVLATGLH